MHWSPPIFRENLRKERENLKNLVDDLKKRSSEIFAVKMEIFLQKIVIQKSWARRKNCPPPQTRRRQQGCRGSGSIACRSFN